MSFKREGDDQSQLNILKKRRVADLLSNFISEDEAALMKNGRYTCLVCSYRPVFDTVDMLTVHRKGKRHIEGLKWYYGKKTELKNEISKRQHENYVQAEDSRQQCSSSAPLLAQTQELTQHALLNTVPYNSSHHALLKTVPYNSCHRKTSTKCEKGALSTSSSSSLSPSSTTPSEHKTFERTEEGVNKLPPKTSCSSTAESRPFKHKQGSHSAVIQKSEPVTAQRKRELEHYLKLKSDGWVQDRCGQWVKDENVEFDSDDEEPPLLAPLPPSD